MIEIVDTPNDVRRYLPKLSSVHTVIRYITSLSPSSEKHVKLPEVKAIKAAGKKLALVHEVYGDFKHAGHGGISAADGRRDGAYARKVLPKLGAPAGACVYFAVDTDGTAAQLKNNVLPYFQAVRAAFDDGEYRVGIYGPGAFCQAVLDAEYVDLCWLANAKGWKGFNAFKPKAALVQQLPTRISGLDVDPDYSQVEDWGQFVPFEDDAAMVAEAEPDDVTAAVTDEEEAPPRRLASGDGDSFGNTMTGIASAASVGGLGVFGKVKSLVQSKIAWVTGALGGTGATTAVSSDPETQSLLMALLHKPTFWLTLMCLVLAGTVLYFYWRDHGKGALR